MHPHLYTHLLNHSHTLANTGTHIHTHAPTPVHSLTHSNIHSHMHTHTPTYTHTCTHTLTHSLTHTHTQTNPHLYTHTLSNSLTDTHTHTHTLYLWAYLAGGEGLDGPEELWEVLDGDLQAEAVPTELQRPGLLQQTAPPHTLQHRHGLGGSRGRGPDELSFFTMHT